MGASNIHVCHSAALFGLAQAMHTLPTTPRLFSNRLRAASKAFALHLGISTIVALLAAWLVLGIWFAYPLRSLAGGQHLFWTLVGVDMVCGPLLTLVLFNPAKSLRELRLDLSLVALVQLAALAYGLYSISLARPVIQAFETDRFAVVSAAEVDPDQLQQALPALRTLPWNGPRLVGVRLPRDGNETLYSIELSLQGVEPSARPGWWQPYKQSIPAIQKRMKKLADLRSARPAAEQALIDQAVRKTGQPLEALFYLPLTSRKNLDDWIVLLNGEATIVGYAPVSGF